MFGGDGCAAAEVNKTFKKLSEHILKAHGVLKKPSTMCRSECAEGIDNIKKLTQNLSHLIFQNAIKLFVFALNSSFGGKYKRTHTQNATVPHRVSHTARHLSYKP